MTTLEKIQEIFRDVFDNEEIEINNETTSKDIEDWDSLTHVQLIVKIEKAFGIKFTMKEIREAANVGDLINYIEKKL